MIILIDSGNTRIKVGWLDQPAMPAGPGPAPTTLPTQPALPPVRGASAFAQDDAGALCRWLDALPQPPTLALGANVAGTARGNAILDELARRGSAMRWVKPRAQALGLTSGYKNPAQLGADRWTAMLGVHARLPLPRPAFLLACFGTATTIDTVSAQSLFEGGLILPGPAMMRLSLAAGAADLPLADGTPSDYPVDTHQAIASGIAAAQAGAVLRQWLAGIRRYGNAPAIYVAGGGWNDVAQETLRLLAEAASAMKRLPPAVQVVDNPVLDGLASLAATLESDLP